MLFLYTLITKRYNEIIIDNIILCDYINVSLEDTYSN